MYFSASVKVSILLFTLASSCPALATEILKTTAIEEAQSFVMLLDKEEYQSAYWSGSQDFRLLHKENQWVDQFTMRRQRLGKVIHRVLKAARPVKSYPDMPDGKYFLVYFESVTTRKNKATEIVLVNTEGGFPKVSFYMLR